MRTERKMLMMLFHTFPTFLRWRHRSSFLGPIPLARAMALKRASMKSFVSRLAYISCREQIRCFLPGVGINCSLLQDKNVPLAWFGAGHVAQEPR